MVGDDGARARSNEAVMEGAYPVARTGDTTLLSEIYVIVATVQYDM